VLERVEGDLALGHTHVAINRLTMAVKASPSDLVLRHRLAALHRQVGNWPEAGRWGYFESAIDERSRQAFEKAWRDPQAQRLALRWTRSADDPEVVRVRLDALEELVPDEAPRQAASNRQDGADSVDSPLACLIVGVLVVLFVLGIGAGIVTLVRWVA
jgi:hypothetical protein